MDDHKIGDVLLGYQGFPGSKKEILGVIKSVTNEGLYYIQWMSEPGSESIVDVRSIGIYKRNLRAYLANSSSR